MRNDSKKYIILGSLCALLMMLTVAYSAFNSILNIKGTSNITSNWDVRITNVVETNKNGSAETVGNPTWTETTANIEANLYDKEDYIEYEVTVENRGTLNATLENIKDELTNNNEAIKISFKGYIKGEKLYKNTSQNITVRIEYNPEFTGVPEEGSTEINLDLNYVQAEGGTITPVDKYLLTYDANGGKTNANNEYLEEGADINLNYTAEKKDYTFIGWNIDKESKEALQEYKMPAEDTTLYAIYKSNGPDCEITVTKATLDTVTVHANCTAVSKISDYNYSINGGEYDNTTKDEYTFDSFKLSTIKVEVGDTLGNKGTFQISNDNLEKGYNIIYNVLNEENENVQNQTNTFENEFLDKAYPIGSIYITTTNTNPSDIVGGTWEAFGQGRTLIGVGSNGEDEYSQAELTGGNETVTLATTNMPEHFHKYTPTGTATGTITGSFDANTSETNDATWKGHNHYINYGTTSQANESGVSNVGLYYVNCGFGDRGIVNQHSLTSSTSGAHTHIISKEDTSIYNLTENNLISTSVGGAESIDIMNPYIVTYMWKRTA